MCPVDPSLLRSAAPPPPKGVVSEDVACPGCGYNLKGLARSGKCPECGRLITGRSRRVARMNLMHAPLAWLRRVHAGLVMLTAGLGAGGCLTLALFAPGFWSARFHWVGAAMLVVLSATAVGGAVLATESRPPDPDNPAPGAVARPRLRRIALALFGCAVLSALFLGAASLASAATMRAVLAAAIVPVPPGAPAAAPLLPPGPSPYTWGVLALVAAAPALVGFMLLLARLAPLADEAGDVDTSERLRSASLSAPLSAVGIFMAVSVLRMAGAIRNVGWQVLGLVFGAAICLVLFWPLLSGWYGLFRLRSTIGWAISNALTGLERDQRLAERAARNARAAAEQRAGAHGSPALVLPAEGAADAPVPGAVPAGPRPGLRTPAFARPQEGAGAYDLAPPAPREP